MKPDYQGKDQRQGGKLGRVLLLFLRGTSVLKGTIESKSCGLITFHVGFHGGCYSTQCITHQGIRTQCQGRGRQHRTVASVGEGFNKTQPMVFQLYDTGQLSQRHGPAVSSCVRWQWQCPPGQLAVNEMHTRPLAELQAQNTSPLLQWKSLSPRMFSEKIHPPRQDAPSAKHQ